MKINYDKAGDILSLRYVPPSADHVMREVSEGVYVLSHGDTGEVVGYEIHGLRQRPGDFIEVTLPSLLEARRGG